MRNSDGTLNGDLNDNLPALTSGSIVRYDSSSLDENQTSYDLLPIIINRPPSIIASITETSTPKIKPYSTADATGTYMYIFPDDSVKINLGATITLKLEAEQPNVFNVENGIPKIIPSSAGLVFVWKKDGNILTSYNINSLQSTINVTDNILEFINIQPEHAGTYTCEVSNDIGTTVSEPITIEVLNLDFDSYFYKNLVQNPYGKNGTDNWESTTSDLITKPFSQTPSQEFARPTAINLFGYTPDMLNPRPYQIDAGVIKGFDMTKDLIKGGTFFTRARYQFDKKGGAFLIRAYQDVDLTDIEWLIKGGVYGVEGVRAMFSCYIGNALDAFVPTEDLVDPTKRINSKSYLSTYPRISVENFLNSGPSVGLSGKVYVTVEEFDNETRLASRIINPDGSTTLKTDRILLIDPWYKRLMNYWSWKYYSLPGDINPNTYMAKYKTDKYGIGQSSNGDGADQILFAADDLLPDLERRYTYGQYAEFNKVILDKLNPNTTKIRITMHFETSDSRIFESWKPDYESVDEPFEFNSYQRPYTKHSFNLSQPNDWTNTIKNRIENLTKNIGKDRIEVQPTSADPRGMITALNLILIPILTQDKDTTDYYTNQTLNLNDTPASITPSGLQPGRGYDPFGKGTRRLNVGFNFNVDPTCYIDSNDLITQQSTLEFGFTQLDPQTQQTSPFPIDNNNLYPFTKKSPINIEAVSSPLSKTQNLTNEEQVSLNNYIIKRYVAKTANSASAFASDLSDNINGYGWVMNIDDQTRISEPTNDVPSHWNGKARFQLNFALPSSSVDENTTNYYNGFTILGPSFYSEEQGRWLQGQYRLQSYYLNMDFTSGSGKSSITLSRQGDLYPGAGNVSYNLSHSISPYGKLILQVPGKLLSDNYANGGMEYIPIQPANLYPIKVSSDMIQCVAALHRNIGNYLVPNNVAAKNYYNNLGAKIVAPLERDRAYLQQTQNTTVLYYKWKQGSTGDWSYHVSLTPPPYVGFQPNSYQLDDFIRDVEQVTSTSISTQTLYVYTTRPPALMGGGGQSTVIESPTPPVITSQNNAGIVTSIVVNRQFGIPADPIMYWKYPNPYGQSNRFSNISATSLGTTNPPGIPVRLSEVTPAAKTGTYLYVFLNSSGIISETNAMNNQSNYSNSVIVPIPTIITGYGNYVYSGSYDIAALTDFSQSLATYIQDKTKPTSRIIYKNINNDYTGEIIIKTLNVNSYCTTVLPNLMDIAQTQLSNGRRPSLYGIKPVDPGMFNDGVGSPSYGTDPSGDWTITYAAIKDSYTKTL
jgi:hypothetical protein